MMKIALCGQEVSTAFSLSLAYRRTYHEARWPEIEGLLLDKVSDALNEEQKRQFIKDLLQEMRIEGTITTVGRTKGAKWVLTPGTSNNA